MKLKVRFFVDTEDTEEDRVHRGVSSVSTKKKMYYPLLLNKMF